ncbi:MAG: hypothetical protein ACJAS4_003919 [Bacteriovoracaceae bacterium]|jgi:hypothetical protein
MKHNLKLNLKHIILLVVSLVFIFTLLIILGEIVLRTRIDKLIEAKPSFNSGEYLCEWNDSLHPDPFVGFLYGRNSFCSFKNINSNGFLSAEFPKERMGSDTYNILLLGASVAFNLYAGQDLQLSGYLKNELEQNYLGPNNKEVRLHSTAIPAWKQPQQLNSFIQHGHLFDAVLSIEGFNELGNFKQNEKFNSPQDMLWHIFIPAKFLVGQTGSFLKMIEKAKVIFPLLKKSFIYNSFYTLVRNNIFSRIENIKGRGDHPYQYYLTAKISPREAIKEYIEILDTIKELSIFNKQNLRIFIQPSMYYAKELSEVEKKISLKSKINIERIYNSYSTLNEILATHKYGYISNLTEIFKNEMESIYFDPVHMGYSNGKNLGHEIMVKRILEDLVQNWGLKIKN